MLKFQKLVLKSYYYFPSSHSLFFPCSVQVAILLTVFLGIVLTSSELVSELGVTASNVCKPEIQIGSVIIPGDIATRLSTVFMVACVGVSNLNFNEGKLSSVKAGISRNLTANFCFSCIPSENEYIIRNCSVEPWKTYSPGDLFIGIQKSRSFLDHITTAFQETSGSNPKWFEGYGDIIRNNEVLSAYLFSPGQGKVIHFLEYNEQKLLNRLRDQAGKGITQYGRTQEPVTVYNISCEENQLSPDNFSFVAQMYRTAALENFVTPAAFNRTTKQFNHTLSPEFFYRAVLAAKIVDRVEYGSYKTYTECGMYDLRYIIPLLSSFTFLFLLRCSACIGMMRNRKSDISDDIRHWNIRAQLLQKDKLFRPPKSFQCGDVFKPLFDHVVLVDMNNEYDEPESSQLMLVRK